MKHYLPTAALLACLIIGSLVSATGCKPITSSAPTSITTTATSLPTKTSPPTTSSIQVGDITIIVEACVDDPEGDIGFDNLTVTKGFLDQDYQPLYISPESAKKGAPCLLISGNITNKSGKRYWVAYHADGFDKSGNQVSWTLDAGPIIGVAQLSFEQTKIESFVLHQSWSENVSLFRIHSQKSAIMFP